MTPLERRLAKIEAAKRGRGPNDWTRSIRIVQDGELTPAQVTQIDEATAAGVNIILRKIVDPCVITSTGEKA